MSLLKGKNVLVVDDDSDLRETIVFDLTRKGCNVFEAENGTMALPIVQSSKIDIVISDVRMPNGDGVSLLKEIKKNNARIPVVLLATGFADLTESEALQMGAFCLLDKPMDRKRMLVLLEKSASLL